MIIDGKQLARTLREQLKQRVAKLPFQPMLCDIVVGSDPVSLSFVRVKQKAAEEIGIKFNLVALPDSATFEQIVETMNAAQAEGKLCGLIVQLPLPQNLDAAAILHNINPVVDVDVLNGGNFTPPTAGAILYILDSLNLDLDQEKIVVIGQGNLVGKPVTKLLQDRGIKITTVDIMTPNSAELIRSATVIISGVGKPGLITAPQVADGVVIIDAGTSEAGGVITGDVDFVSIQPKSRAITPVPGGVGPVTVAKLLENVVLSAENRANP